MQQILDMNFFNQLLLIINLLIITVGVPYLVAKFVSRAILTEYFNIKYRYLITVDQYFKKDIKTIEKEIEEVTTGGLESTKESIHK